VTGLALAGALSGCDAIEALLGEDDPPNCDTRRPYWPDADGDGVGDPGTSVYIGCDAPEGYVETGPPPPDTASPPDTDVADTGVADTDVADTGAADTGVDTDPDTGASTDTADTDPVDTADTGR